MYPVDTSVKCTTSKLSKTTSPIQRRRSSKSSNHRKLIKHMTEKAFFNRTTDGDDKLKIVDEVTTSGPTCEHSSLHNLDLRNHPPVQNEVKIRNEVESGSIRNTENVEGVQEVDASYLIEKLRVKRKTLVRALTIHAAASDEQCKSISGSKIVLGKAISMCISFSFFFVSMFLTETSDPKFEWYGCFFPKAKFRILWSSKTVHFLCRIYGHLQVLRCVTGSKPLYFDLVTVPLVNGRIIGFDIGDVRIFYGSCFA